LFNVAGNETFERLAAFGLFANFMVYLTREFHLDQVYASNILNLWSGVTNFFPLVGAFISDAYVGRFRTIAFASFSSLLVLLSLPLFKFIYTLSESTSFIIYYHFVPFFLSLLCELLALDNTIDNQL